jgi:iron complex transport system substrate-binding protein
MNCNMFKINGKKRLERKLFMGFLAVVFMIALKGNAATETTGMPVDPNQLRIVCLAPSHTEILYTLGLRHSVIGVTEYCDFPSEVLDDKANGKVKIVGQFVKQDRDKILSLKPTLVLTCYYEPKEIIEELKARGIQTMHFFPKSLEDVFKMIETLGEVTGTGDRAYQLTSSYRQSIEQIQSQTKHLTRVSVYFEVHHEPPFTVGSLSPVNDIIKIAGGRNIFGDLMKPSHQPVLKDIWEQNPEVILSPMWSLADVSEITTLYEIMTRPGFSITPAVQNGRVIYYDSSLFKRPGPRQILAIRKLAYLLHPNHFTNPMNSGPPWELGRIDISGDSKQ